MKVTIASDTKLEYSDNDKNSLSISSFNDGGSSTDFDSPSSPTEVLNDFKVTDVIHKVIELDDSNTFDKTMSTLFGVTLDKLAFLKIFCYNATGGEKKLPMRFNVDINTVHIGFMSELSLGNAKTLESATEVRIYGVVVPTDKVANLVIIAGII